MSEGYIQRLRSIQTDFNSAREAIGYIQRNWDKHNIHTEILLLKPASFEKAGRNVETTYFISLYAEFEGILKDHLSLHHPHIPVPAKPKVDWLIGQVTRAEQIAIDPILRRKMDNVRDYRNSLAHRTRAAVPAITFADALSVLNTFLAKIPHR